MKLIGENIHIISKSVREAIIERNESFIESLVKRQIESGVQYLDLNVGPAKKALEGSMAWLVSCVRKFSDLPLSFDSSNTEEIEAGLKMVKNPEFCFINSTSADCEKLETTTDLAKKYEANLICLTMNKELGIPKTADERLSLAFETVETANAKGIDNTKLYFDPLILPISVEQSQACEALSAIRMFKESFDPSVMTTIGLSNVSNGSPKDLRPLINRVFFVLACGCGLDSAIVDAFDGELLRLNSVLESGNAENKTDEFVLTLCETMRNFEELETVFYDKNDLTQVQIFKTAEILLNKKVYSHSYLEI